MARCQFHHFLQQIFPVLKRLRSLMPKNAPGEILFFFDDAIPSTSTSQGIHQKQKPFISSATCSGADADDHEHWTNQLSALFPDLSHDDIDMALVGVDSVEEAANKLLDSTNTESEESTFSFEPMNKISNLKNKELFPVQVMLPPRSLDEFLSRFVEKVIGEEYEELFIDRECVWTDTLKYYKRKIVDSKNLKKKLEVSFLGEDGLDGGAVKSEYFQIVFDEVGKRLFEGDNMNLVPVKDSTKLFLFRMTGTLIVHLIVQNGPLYSVPALAPSATESLHNFVELLDAAKTEDDINTLLYKDGSKDVYWQLINSCHWPIKNTINLNSKNLLMQELIYNELVASRRQEIEEIRAGLELYGFLAFAKQHPCFAREILSENENLRKPFGFEELKTIIVSQPKSFEQRQAQTWFFEYLQEIDDHNQLVNGSRINAVLQFSTGHKCLPRNGFRSKKKLEFLKLEILSENENLRKPFGFEELKTIIVSQPKSFEQRKAQSWFFEYVQEIDDHNQLLNGSRINAVLQFSTGHKCLPRNGFRSKIKLEFLPDDDQYTMPTSSACLQILRLPTAGPNFSK